MYDPTQEKIYSLAPECMERASIFIDWLRSNGVPMMVISGRRSRELNAAVGGAVNSRHLSGNAFDVQVAGYTRDQVPFSFWQYIGQVAEVYLGLRWGGRFNPPDVNHFDYPG